MIEFNMPSLGADMEAGTLVEWRVKPGDKVKRGDIIADVDTQKGLIEVEVFDSGTIDKLVIKEGEKVPVGTLMALIAPEKEATETATAPATTATSTAVPETQPATVEMAAPVQSGNGHAAHTKASPLARKMAADNQIDISKIKGTGEGGAVVKNDIEKLLVQQAVTQTSPAQETTPTPKAKTTTTTETIRKAVAAAMSKSNREIPHYYLETKIDMSRALSWLTETNKNRPVDKRLLSSVLLIKATAKALNEVKELNAYWNDGLQLKENVNIGFVIALRTGGIVVPAIHDADKKTLDEVMTAMTDIITRSRAMKLRSSDLTDSTVTITSLGETASDTVFGVIYPPQVALIGFGGIKEQPWAENGMLGIRPVISITLAADHRASDGITGNRFLLAMKDHLQNPENMS